MYSSTFVSTCQHPRLNMRLTKPQLAFFLRAGLRHSEFQRSIGAAFGVSGERSPLRRWHDGGAGVADTDHGGSAGLGDLWNLGDW